MYSHVGDKLVSVNDQVLLYDEYGRLTDYNNKQFSWQSNRLASVDDVAITYDAFGRRVQKGATTFTYDSNNNLLTAGDLAFFYDTHGVAGFTYAGATYFYRKNIQGDVIALLDSTGTVVATYTYDAWGNCVVATDTNGIGETNPIRYRSYYWDDEFGLYFLQSRYYSPSLCRFISQDSIEYLDSESINGINLYAYCLNNPVMFADADGYAPKWWQSILIGVGVIAVAALIAAAIVYTGGGAAAFFAAAGQAALGGLKIAAVAGATAGIVRAGKTAIEGGNIGDVGKSLVLGFSDGFLAGSVYAAGSMILGAVSFKISGLINNGYGWSYSNYVGGYQTPRTPGISLITHLGGINGGRSFGFDLDIYNSFHFHFKLGEKVNNPILKKLLGGVGRHRWSFAPIMIGVSIGLSDGWSEW